MKANRLLTSILALCLLTTAQYQAQTKYGQPRRGMLKLSTNDQRAWLTQSFFKNVYYNNGLSSYDASTNLGNAEFPAGLGGTVIYVDGFLWGGMHKGTVKVGGSAYRAGLQAGRILVPGASPTADDPSQAKYRVYRVRRDITPATPTADAYALLAEEQQYLVQKENLSVEQLYANYVADWNEWPAAFGAPFEDKNGNGTYEPGVDIPGVKGADQTLWHVSNDLNPSRTVYLYGSQPIGLEFQRTIWAYRRPDQFGNMIFVSNKIVNKSDSAVTDMYLTEFSDPDIGGDPGANDDYVGCDTLLSLGYSYNGTSNDGFFGPRPPAIGYVFLQGPMVAGIPTDTAVFNFGKRIGFKNLKMSSFNFFINSSGTYLDPVEGSYSGTTQWYNLMRGLVGPTGASYIDPVTGKTTKFVLPGDPVLGTGWIDGMVAPPGDRRMALSTGPFRLAPGDTQEVVVGLVGALGVDRLASVAGLKVAATYVRQAYNNSFQLLPLPPPVVVPEANTAPSAEGVALDGGVLLDWSRLENYGKTESYNKNGYFHYEYRLYQTPGPGFDHATAIFLGSFKNNVRTYSSKTDALSGFPMANGVPYHYALTSVIFNYQASVPLIESPPAFLTVVPQAGVAAGLTFGDTVSAAGRTTKIGSSDAWFSATLANPDYLTGSVYRIRFDTSAGALNWSLVDTTRHLTLIDRSTDFSGSQNVTIDGLMWNVFSPSPGIKGVLLVQNGSSPVNPPVSILRTGPVGNWMVDVTGSTDISTALTRMNWQNYAGSSDYELRVTPNDATASEYYTTPSAGALGTASVKAATRIPLQAWDVTYNQRLLMNVADDSPVDQTYGRTSGGVVTQLGAGVGWERIYLSRAISYAEPLPATAPMDWPVTEVLGRIVFVDINNTGYFPPAGTIVRIVTNKPAKPGDAFVLNTTSLASGPKNTVSIIHARSLPNGSQTEVEGIVTRAKGAYTRIQDNTGALVVKQTTGTWRDAVTAGTIRTGTKVHVQGRVSEYRYQKQIADADILSFTVMSQDNSVPPPIPVKLRDIAEHGEFYESKLLKVNRVAIEGTGPIAAGVVYMITDASDSTYRVMLRMPAASDGEVQNTMIPLQADLVGVGGQFSTLDSAAGYQILPVLAGDLAESKVADWQASITFHDAGGDLSTRTLLFGQHPLATSGIDAALGEYALPPVPAGSMDARFILPTQPVTYSLSDIRSAFDSSGSLSILLSYASPSSPISISWMPASLPTGEFRLKDQAGSFDINMRSQNTVLLSNTSVTMLQIVYTGILLAAQEGRSVPRTYALRQNYPNPFNPSTVIRYQLPVVGHVSLRVFDLLGREVVSLVDSEQLAGEYQVVWNGAHAATGIYFCRIQCNGFVQTRKMMLIR